MNKLLYTLQLADNALILGHRISEWCGHGPVLEQDIAITNIALDHLGQARALYQYAAQLINEMPAPAKAKLFRSAPLQDIIASGEAVGEDDLAYLRDAGDFRNTLLVEQPNRDWAFTIARSFLYDAANMLIYQALSRGNDTSLAAIAVKSVREVTYHLRWSSEWVIRLGDGTSESHQRMQLAINDYWMYTGELLTAVNAEREVLMAAGAISSEMQDKWFVTVATVLQEATLQMPVTKWMQTGGKEGQHSEHIGYLLAEMQFMQRAYPHMDW